MKRFLAVAAILAAPLLAAPVLAAQHGLGLGVEVWTDRGNEAVYQPGEQMVVKARPSENSYLLVYEIDTEGYVRVLEPYRGRPEMIEGGQTVLVPPEDADVELVVQESVGQSYLVAIASAEPFRDMPWYLRPYSAQGEALGYVGKPDDEEGITAEGRIVGDPFVAMERIRRRVLANPDDEESFGTSYTSYYVHQEVRYPRYLCYDCHRPNHYAFWDGFDPYYATCSVFTFRVNWSWYWGPSYWFGSVPYYVYVYRPDCPPRYTRYYESGIWYSSWDGWTRWSDLWGAGGLRRYKSPPPAGYVPPTQWKQYTARMPAERQVPPGYLGPEVRTRGAQTGGIAGRVRTLFDRNRNLVREEGRQRRDRVGDGPTGRPVVERTPATRGERGGSEPRRERGGSAPRREPERGRSEPRRDPFDRYDRWRPPGRSEPRRDPGAEPTRRDPGTRREMGIEDLGRGRWNQPDPGRENTGRDLIREWRIPEPRSQWRMPEPRRETREPGLQREWRNPEPQREWRNPEPQDGRGGSDPAPGRGGGGGGGRAFEPREHGGGGGGGGGQPQREVRPQAPENHGGGGWQRGNSGGGRSDFSGRGGRR